MVTRIAEIILVGALVFSGCAPHQTPQTGSMNNIDPQTGNLIAFWLVYPDTPEYYPQKEKAVLVTEPYAVFMVWSEDERRFYVYDNVAKRTFGTADFDGYLEALGALPQGIAVQKFVTCTTSATRDMPREAAVRLGQVMQAGNRTWAISSATGQPAEIVCYCETLCFRYPE